MYSNKILTSIKKFLKCMRVAFNDASTANYPHYPLQLSGLSLKQQLLEVVERLF
jgi:hypothetical protein